MGDERSTLSRELGGFLIELAIALNKRAIYPDGHPALAPTAGRVLEKVQTLLLKRSGLALGIARDRLVIDGVATDPQNAVLLELATRLHRHQLAAVSFHRGVTEPALDEALRAFAADPDRTGEPLGLAAKEGRNTWTGIKLYALDYEALELLDEGAQEGPTSPTEIAQLWIALARAVLEAEAGSAGPEESDPRTLARTIANRSDGAEYDEVIVDYMLKLAAELRHGGEREAVEIRRRVSELVAALEPDLLVRLLDTTGDLARRQEFLLDASQGLALDAVIALVRAAGQAHEQQISHSLLRLFEKLAAHTGSSDAIRRGHAEPALREQIAKLISGWALDDPNPTPYAQALGQMAASGSHFAPSSDSRTGIDAARIVQLTLEAGVAGAALETAANRMAEDGRIAELLSMAEQAPESAASMFMWEQLLGERTLERLLQETPLDVDSLDRILARMGVSAADTMLDALGLSESAQTRRVLLSRLVRLGPPVAPIAAARLRGAPWYLQRNILRLLTEVEVLPAGVDPEVYAEASDPRVRVEAVRLMLSQPGGRGRAILLALADRDARVREIGLLAASDGCPPAAVPHVAELAVNGGSERLSVIAIRALGTTENPVAAGALLQLVRPRRNWLSRRAPAKTRAYLEALRALRRHEADPDVAHVLDAAARSDDPDVVRAVTGEEALV